MLLRKGKGHYDFLVINGFDYNSRRAGSENLHPSPISDFFSFVLTTVTNCLPQQCARCPWHNVAQPPSPVICSNVLSKLFIGVHLFVCLKLNAV